MPSKLQISIAFPRQVTVPDNVATVIEQVIGYLLGGGAVVSQPTAPIPVNGGPVAALPSPVTGDVPRLAAKDDLTSDDHVRLSMRLGALLEGGSFGGPWGAGDNGQSWGPFQIYHVAHPQVSRAEAEDPQFAAEFMLPSYEAAAAQVPASLWNSNPEQAAALTVFHAERPFQMYPADRVSAAWARVTTPVQE